MSKMKEKHCPTCKFHFGLAGEVYIECRKRCPVINEKNTTHFPERRMFPIVFEQDWCGDYVDENN